MNVVLINVPYEKVYSLIGSSIGKFPPINLASIAAYLRREGHDVRIIDTIAEEIKLYDLKKYLDRKFDVVGVSSMTPSINESFEVLKIAKTINPNCITIMGGPHISALPEETMRECPYLDYGIIGEGELTTAELLNKIETKGKIENVNSIVYRNNDRVIVNPRRNNISDIDSLPFPAYDLLPMKKYCKKAHHLWSKERIYIYPHAVIYTSRGCIYDCAFCASRVIWGRNVRYKSPEYIINEIDYLVNKFGIKSLDISDDSFLLNKSRVHKILDMLIEKNYNLNFSCMSRVDDIDINIAKKLKKAKCHLIRFGVESCSQTILDSMQKNITLKQIEKAFKIAKEVDIFASACIIIGYPGESKKTFDETMHILLKFIKPDAVDFFIATPIVGTKLFEISEKKRFLISYDWRRYSLITQHPVLKTENLSPRDLIMMRKKAYIKFYLRPKYLLLLLRNILRGIQDFNQLKLSIKGILSFLNILRK